MKLVALFKSTLFLTSFVFLSLGTFAQCLIADWNFNGTVNDASGNNLHGDNHGGILFLDHNGNPNKALKFDGTSNYVVVTNSPLTTFAFDDDFAIALWVNAPSTQATTALETNTLIAQWIDNIFGNEGYPFSIRIHNQTSGNNGKIECLRLDDTCGNVASVMSTSTINDGEHHHLVFMKSGTELSIYIDGIKESTGFDSTSCNTTNDDSLFIARRGGKKFPSFFEGVLDEIKIYKCSLNQNEIDDLAGISNAINELPVNYALQVLPNPAGKSISIVSDLGNNEEIIVYDIHSRVVYRSSFKSKIDISNLVPGIYFLTILDESSVVTQGVTFVKQ